MKFTLVRPECADWEALYIDGRLVREGHSLDAWQILVAIEENLVCEIEKIEISDETAEAGMPTLLSRLEV